MSDYYRWRPDDDTVMAELGRFVTEKRPTQKAKVQRWVSAIRKRVREYHIEVEKKGYKPAQMPRLDAATPEELFENWFWAILSTAKDSTSCGWGTTFCVPTDVMDDTKASCLRVFLEGDPSAREAMLELMSQCQEVYKWMMAGVQPGRMPLFVGGKDEPSSMKKKLDAANHRTIQWPDWTVVIVETRISAFIHEGTLYAHDDVFALLRRSVSGNFRWMCGADMVRELPRLQYEVMKGGKSHFLDYDIKAWDRSLPEEAIWAYYEAFATVHCGAQHKCVGTNLANGMCGKGLYMVGGELLMMPEGTVAWCSGALKTLSGNSLIHDALLECCGYDGVVQGDDGNVFCTDPQKTTAVLEDFYTSVGLQFKQLEVHPHMHFCSVSTIADGATIRIKIDAGKLYQKMAAREDPNNPLGIRAFPLATLLLISGETPDSIKDMTESHRLEVVEQYTLLRACCPATCDRLTTAGIYSPEA